MIVLVDSCIMLVLKTISSAGDGIISTVAQDGTFHTKDSTGNKTAVILLQEPSKPVAKVQ